MAIFIYENEEEILSEFSDNVLPAVEIEADTQEEADEIYRGYDGSRAENKVRDYHV